ncbi:MAG: penicillin acylase family protein, partial [Rhodospirillales bacterium]|nr:penicillin acylase family protein [Rhodospirillales bacterium]
VVVGHNRKITWGATFNPLDVTDVFQEQIALDPSSPSGLSIVHLGVKEPIIPIPQIFRFNQIGDGVPDNLTAAPPGGGIPAAVLIVPRRNDGPIVALNGGTALSIQYTGFSGTQEIDAFRRWNLAEDLDDFVAGLQDFDVGSQNWAYADTRGDIAYFTSAEIPLREDLQAGFVNGLPPFFIRNGTGGNEWLPLASPQPGQAVPYEVLPFAEMPQIANPPRGFFFNANNDPSGITLDNDPLNQPRPGGGIFYLSPGYDIGLRAGRIKQLLEERLTGGGLVSAEDMMDIQADVVLLDAQVFTPIILQAFNNANLPGGPSVLAALAADPRVEEAVGRLSAWDYSTPTGIEEGYDASDVDGVLLPPDQTEVDNSVAATIYSVWRGQIIGNTIDAALDIFSLPRPNSRRSVSALRHLLDSFAVNQGIGASGLDFFNVPGIADAATRRDILVLKSLSDALDLLAGSGFAAAFGGSTDQDDYLWGLLHRIVLDHPLGAPFSIPPAGGAFPPPLAGLPGIPVDGGFVTVDAARHSVRANDSDDFTFDAGPTRRFVAEVRSRPPLVEAETSLPGGESGILGSPFYTDLLPRWLTNDTHPLRLRAGDFASSAVEKLEFEPAPGS